MVKCPYLTLKIILNLIGLFVKAVLYYGKIEQRPFSKQLEKNASLPKSEKRTPYDSSAFSLLLWVSMMKPDDIPIVKLPTSRQFRVRGKGRFIKMPDALNRAERQH